ncbi:MAG: putative MFS family arabinose efflux permease [Verrucomicrobiales bacterium]
MHRLVYIAYMLMVASTGVTFVFLEDIETAYGLPAWGIGLISSLSFITAIFAALVVAPFGDRGHLELLGAIAFVAAIAGNLWIGFADDLWSLSISRGLTGTGAGVFSVVGRKSLIGASTKDSAEKVGGFLSAAVAGFIAGPGIGAQLAEFGGIETPYIVLAALMIIVSFPTLRWLRTVEIATSKEITSRAMLPLLKRPGVRAALAAHVAVFFNIGVFDATIDEYLTDLGLSNTQVGMTLIVIGAPLLFLPRIAGRRLDRTEQPATIMLIALAVFVPVVLAVGLWVGAMVFLALGLIQTSMESVLFPSATRVLLNETDANQSAIATGLLEAGGSAAGAISAFIAPIMYDLTDGPSGPFGMSGVVALTLLIVSWMNVQRIDYGRSVMATA